MTTGIFKSGSICAVFALKALQNSIMFTPCWPNAGPIGGAGFALPAGTCNLIKPVIFLAITHFQLAIADHDLKTFALLRPPLNYQSAIGNRQCSYSSSANV